MKKKKKLQYLRQQVGVRYCGIFLPGNSIRPESKEIIIIIIIIIISVTIGEGKSLVIVKPGHTRLLSHGR